jgi:hypothetical protein
MINAGLAPLAAVSSADPDGEPKFEESQHGVLKTHTWWPHYKTTDFIFTSHRDLRDVVASLNRKFGTAPSLSAAKDAFDHYIDFACCATYDMHYETMMANQRLELIKIATILGISPSLDVSGELSKLKFSKATDFSPHDHENLLHPGHITDGRHGSWSNVPAYVISEIETEYGNWLKSKNYLP